MKKQLLFTALLLTIHIAHSMQKPSSESPTAEQADEIEVKFNDHLLLPDGHMRAIYEPWNKRIHIKSFGTDGKENDRFYPQPEIKFTTPNTTIDRLCGILQYKHYIFYAAIASMNNHEKEALILRSHNMLSNNCTYSHTLEDTHYLSVSSLIISKNKLSVAGDLYNKKNDKHQKFVAVFPKKHHIPDDE